MDSSKIFSLLDRLDDEIDDLEDSLYPLVKTALSKTASKLPLLDKAKLYVLMTYAIESILFSYFRLNGVKAREHPVFMELTRVKQYFDKIKMVESPSVERNQTVDKSAAARFIKAGLSGNNKYDLERAEREAKERVLRARGQVQLGEAGKDNGQKRKLDETEAKDDSDSSDSDTGTQSMPIDIKTTETSTIPVVASPKKSRNKKYLTNPSDSTPESSTSTPSKKKKKSRHEKKRAKKEKQRMEFH